MVSITYDNSDTQNEIQKMQEFEQELKKKKKKLDQKTKFQKALRSLKDNDVKTGHGKKAHGPKKASSSQKKPEVSFMYAMVVALVAQMNTNLQSMGVQAQHVQMLDQNNAKYTQELNSLQQQAAGITNYTDESSLLTSSDVSSEMNILGNHFTCNQQNETKDTGVMQGLQTNSASENGVGQSLLDLDKRIFAQVHFKKG